ncbi:hypothetical protein PQ455_11450 [Sphingomonas naphthae]|uniref:Uncharacterized protein n=1 Tax=Sphingomonas naphthae TaxID=1813468 RepID=A0ABY7TGA1_9SPHN|nr:hypothetical protein [Sphingomonas naphthae]WCT72256.1 hypothetical protein PQ455_11450 [Sphingomonas naphthae]
MSRRLVDPLLAAGAEGGSGVAVDARLSTRFRPNTSTNQQPSEHRIFFSAR